MFNVMELNTKAPTMVRRGDSVGVTGPGMYREKRQGLERPERFHITNGMQDNEEEGLQKICRESDSFIVLRDRESRLQILPESRTQIGECFGKDKGIKNKGKG